MRLLLGLMWPMLLGLAVLSRPVIHTLYGAKWQAAAVPLSMLRVAAAVTGGIGMAQEIFILRRETARQMRIESIRTTLGFVMFVGGAMISLPAAAAAKILEALLAFALYRRPMNRLIGGPPGELRRLYAEGFALTFAAVLPALLLMLSTDFAPDTDLFLITASILAGGLLWALLLWRLRHPLAIEVLVLAPRLR